MRIPSDPDLLRASEEFARSRRRLFGIAYRMLGNVADAEDILQDVWIRWQTTDRTAIAEPGAFLTTITTRLSINVLSPPRPRARGWSPAPGTPRTSARSPWR